MTNSGTAVRKSVRNRGLAANRRISSSRGSLLHDSEAIVPTDRRGALAGMIGSRLLEAEAARAVF